MKYLLILLFAFPILYANADTYTFQNPLALAVAGGTSIDTVCDLSFSGQGITEFQPTQVFVGNSSNNTNCALTVLTWDTREIPPSSTYYTATFRVTIPEPHNPLNCTIRQFEIEPQLFPNQQLNTSEFWNEGLNGTIYLNDSNFCTQTTKQITIDLGTDILTDCQAHTSWCAIAISFTNMTDRDTSDHRIVLSNPELQIQYGTTIKPLPAFPLTVVGNATGIKIDWTSPPNFDNTTQPIVTGYNIYRSQSGYNDISLAKYSTFFNTSLSNFDVGNDLGAVDISSSMTLLLNFDKYLMMDLYNTTQNDWFHVIGSDNIPQGSNIYITRGGIFCLPYTTSNTDCDETYFNFVDNSKAWIGIPNIFDLGFKVPGFGISGGAPQDDGGVVYSSQPPPYFATDFSECLQVFELFPATPLNGVCNSNVNTIPGDEPPSMFIATHKRPNESHGTISCGDGVDQCAMVQVGDKACDNCDPNNPSGNHLRIVYHGFEIGCGGCVAVSLNFVAPLLQAVHGGVSGTVDTNDIQLTLSDRWYMRMEIEVTDNPGTACFGEDRKLLIGAFNSSNTLDERNQDGFVGFAIDLCDETEEGQFGDQCDPDCDNTQSRSIIPQICWTDTFDKYSFPGGECEYFPIIYDEKDPNDNFRAWGRCLFNPSQNCDPGAIAKPTPFTRWIEVWQDGSTLNGTVYTSNSYDIGDREDTVQVDNVPLNMGMEYWGVKSWEETPGSSGPRIEMNIHDIIVCDNEFANNANDPCEIQLVDGVSGRGAEFNGKQFLVEMCDLDRIIFSSRCYGAGSNDPGVDIDTTKSWSLSTFVKLAQAPAESILFTYVNGSNTGEQFEIGFDVSDFRIKYDDIVIVEEPVNFVLNTWTHLGFTRDGDSWRLYQDGQQVGMDTVNSLNIGTPFRMGSFDPNSGHIIGANFDRDDKFFNGVLDEFVITNIALSDSTMFNIAQRGLEPTLIQTQLSPTDFTDGFSSNEQRCYQVEAINSIGLGSRTIIECSFGTGGASPGSGGGGDPPTVIEFLDVELTASIFRPFFGELVEKEYKIVWDSDSPIKVNSIVVADSPFMIVFPDIPFVLEADDSGDSEAIIPFTVRIPEGQCSGTIFLNCVDPRFYEIPVEFGLFFKGTIIQVSTDIRIDMSREVDLVIYAVFGMVGIAVVGVIGSSLKSKPHKRQIKLRP